MIIGVDVGFSAVKGITAESRTLFPSVVGTPRPKATFSLISNGDLIISVNGSRFVPVGESALLHSTHVSGRLDASWVLGDEWQYLLCGALVQLCPVSTAQHGGGIRMVTGLPVSDYEYAVPLREKIEGQTFRIQREGHADILETHIERLLVVTQPYGSLADQALRDDGRVQDSSYSTGYTGIVDIGGNTLNLLATDHMREIPRLTTSDEFGLLHVLSQVASDIRSAFKRFTPDTHEVSEWLASGKFRYAGEWHGIDQYADLHLQPLIELIVSKINDTWPEAGRFDRILLTGGGSAALARYIKARLANVFTVDVQTDPRWGNANGYLKLAQRAFGDH